MDIVTIINTISSTLDALIDLIPKVIALASVTAAFLPPENFMAVWVNRAAFNFKHAKNKADAQ